MLFSGNLGDFVSTLLRDSLQLLFAFVDDSVHSCCELMSGGFVNINALMANVDHGGVTI